MNFNIIAIISSLIYGTLGHMSMQFPAPRDRLGGSAYAVWQQNEPMISVHPTICHGLDADTTVRSENVFTAGDTVSIVFAGSASHNGGHCSFWISTDDITFTKIIDVIDCTLSTKQIIMPANLPAACATKCTFAMTWIPLSSGACEIYMNCADIRVSGVNGNLPSDVSKNFNDAYINNGASRGCVRVDNLSKLSTAMAPNFLDYQNVETPTDPDNPIEIEDPIDQGNCYSNPTMAKWLSNDIDNMGRCGVPNPTAINRCDDGQCCSEAGYCGPEFDGSGYIKYDDFGNNIGYYSTNTEAYAVYCGTNALGDWRVGACGTGGTTSNANQKSIIVSIIFSLFFIIYFIF